MLSRKNRYISVLAVLIFLLMSCIPVYATDEEAPLITWDESVLIG